MNRMESEYVIENALKLCDIERSVKRETIELQNSIKEKYDWLEKYLLS